jgi:UDP-2,3-diacylglucosamine pyrophosphatase LpxH
VAHWLKGRVKRWGGVLGSVKRGAVEYARQNHCDGIILGHTHYSADEVCDGIHYLNSGCWVDSPCTYIRAEGSRIRVCRWDSRPLPVMSIPAIEQRSTYRLLLHTHAN